MKEKIKKAEAEIKAILDRLQAETTLKVTHVFVHQERSLWPVPVKEVAINLGKWSDKDY